MIYGGEERLEREKGGKGGEKRRGMQFHEGDLSSKR